MNLIEVFTGLLITGPEGGKKFYDSTLDIDKTARTVEREALSRTRVHYFGKILVRITSGKYFTEFISSNCAQL